MDIIISQRHCLSIRHPTGHDALSDERLDSLLGKGFYALLALWIMAA